MKKEIALIEVETLREVRLNGNDEPAGKLVKIPVSLLNIWLGKGLCKLPEANKEPEIIKVSENIPENIPEIKPEFPQKIENGLYLLSDGTEFKGGKQKAIEAENALKG